MCIDGLLPVLNPDVRILSVENGYVVVFLTEEQVASNIDPETFITRGLSSVPVEETYCFQTLSDVIEALIDYYAEYEEVAEEDCEDVDEEEDDEDEDG